MPEITWYHDDKIITENQDFNLSYDLESGACTLLIAEVFPQDAGEYKCVAVNSHGDALTRAMLEVECKYTIVNKQIQKVLVPYYHSSPIWKYSFMLKKITFLLS